MKEIGGYFQLEEGRGAPLHSEAALINSARNALRCIVRAMGVKAIQVPYYTCPVVWHALEAERCELIPYDVDDAFMPLCTATKIPLLYTNYFGVCSENVRNLKERFSTLIVDNAQAFYTEPEGTACFWSPRKFFGLPDGGIMWPASCASRELPVSESWQRCSHLLKRWDLGAGAAYADFQQNDASLNSEPPLAMSKLTRAMMSSLDIETAQERRRENFRILHEALGETNLLPLDLEAILEAGAVPMVYPYRIKASGLRRHLIENKIFVATYWPAEEGCDCMRSELAQLMAQEILPVPLDQRYNREDMERIIEIALETRVA